MAAPLEIASQKETHGREKEIPSEWRKKTLFIAVEKKTTNLTVTFAKCIMMYIQ